MARIYNPIKDFGMPPVNMYGTNDKICYTMPDDWLVEIMAIGLANRMARNNTSYCYYKYGVNAQRLPISEDGGMYSDCSNDVTTLPRFWGYINGTKGTLAKCYAAKRFGYTFNDLFDIGYVETLPNITPEQASECRAYADKLAPLIVERCKYIWYRRTNNWVERFDDVIQSVTGRPSLEGDGTSEFEEEWQRTRRTPR